MNELFNKAEIEAVKGEVTKKLNIVEAATIRSQPDLEGAIVTLGKIALLKKALKQKKDGVLIPLNTALKNVRELFAPTEYKINEAEAGLKQKMLAYQQSLEVKVEAKQQEIVEKVEAGELSIEKAAPKLEKLEQQTKVAPTRTYRDIEVVDNDQIPDRYWVVDIVAVRRDALAGVEVPGVKVVEKTTIVSRAI